MLFGEWSRFSLHFPIPSHHSSPFLHHQSLMTSVDYSLKTKNSSIIRLIKRYETINNTLPFLMAVHFTRYPLDRSHPAVSIPTEENKIDVPKPTSLYRSVSSTSSNLSDGLSFFSMDVESDSVSLSANNTDEKEEEEEKRLEFLRDPPLGRSFVLASNFDMNVMKLIVHFLY